MLVEGLFVTMLNEPESKQCKGGGSGEVLWTKNSSWW